MTRLHWLAGSGVALILGATAIAQEGNTPARGAKVSVSPTVRLLEPWRPATVKTTTDVIGSVIDYHQVPVVGVRVQLRDLERGAVVNEALTDERGEYQFEVQEPSTYVVELVVADDVIVAVSNAGAVARFETLRTLVQLAGRWDAAKSKVLPPERWIDFIGMSSAQTMTAGTLQMASSQYVPPAESGEPVSAFNSR